MEASARRDLRRPARLGPLTLSRADGPEPRVIVRRVNVAASARAGRQ